MREWPLTVSGNEVTDRIRAAADQGDGLKSDSSFGLWAAATNLALNSNAKTNTTSIIDVGATTTRETSGLVGADTTRFKTVTANAATAEGTSQLIDGGAGSTQYTFSCWLSGTGTVKLYISDTVGGKQLGSQITLTATPTKYSTTATTGALGITETCGWETDSQQGLTVYHGRWMCETGSAATPHVLTDGAQASRTAARVRIATAGLFSPTQGWVAMRMRMGFGNASALPTTASNFFYWGTGTDRIMVFAGTPGWDVRRSTGTDAFPTGTWVTGEIATFVAAWSATQVKGSYNGGTFATASNSTIPVIAQTTADIGNNSDALTRLIDADCLWFACGDGNLTSADAVTLHTYGNTGPSSFHTPYMTALWRADNGTFLRRF